MTSQSFEKSIPFNLSSINNLDKGSDAFENLEPEDGLDDGLECDHCFIQVKLFQIHWTPFVVGIGACV